MRSKPIINQTNFNKIQKQPLFIVRPKPSQTKLQHPSMANRQLKTSVLCETQKSIDQCMVCLQQQISEQKNMDKIICQRIKQHLMTLRQKLNSQQQGNCEIKKAETSLGILRKQSSKYFTRHKLQPTQERNKENMLLIQGNDKFKLSKSKSNRDDSQAQIQELQLKIQYLTHKLQVYENDYQSFGGQIRKLQDQLNKQIKQKSKYQQQKEEYDRIRQVLFQLQEKHAQTEKKLEACQEWLKQRQSQIICFWQLYSQ